MILRFPIERTRAPVNKPRKHTDNADIERAAAKLKRFPVNYCDGRR